MLRAAGWVSARVPDATIVVSRNLAEHYRARYGRATVYIPNGVERPSTARPPRLITERFGLRGGDFVLFVGRLVPEKAPDLLIRAFAKVPGHTSLVVAGGSSFTDRYTDELVALAAGDPRVLLPGYVYGETLEELYANAAAFVLPSHVEGLPLTLLEAAAWGTPVLASAIPPHRQVLGTDGPGRRLFPPGDADTLAVALERSLDTVDSERAGAAKLRDEVLAEYSWDAAAEATEAVYSRLVGARR